MKKNNRMLFTSFLFMNSIVTQENVKNNNILKKIMCRERIPNTIAYSFVPISIKNPKNNLTFLLLIFSVSIYSQVGIGTTTPQETLHVAGETSTIRIEGLDSTNNINNNGVNVPTVGVDINGNLVIKEKSSILELEEPIFMPTIVSITSTNSLASQTVFTGSTTTTATNTNLNINTGIGLTLTRPWGAGISDGRPKIYGMRIAVNGVLVFRDAKTYTSHSSSGAITGYFTLGGVCDISVGPGVHSISIVVYLRSTGSSVKGNFGTSYKRLTIKKQVID